jgi:suppressor of G2 allele of SKP1
MTKKPEGSDGEENGGADDMDDLDYGGDEANLFFKKLYASADDDTKRAMMKSYVESNGTVLSTNWAEVGKGKVETSPPDGMEAKKWA